VVGDTVSSDAFVVATIDVASRGTPSLETAPEPCPASPRVDKSRNKTAPCSRGRPPRARSRAVINLFKETGIGVAHHQVDIFLFGKGWNDYLGRLCTYAQCPKGKVECLTPGCGREPFLKQHEGFVLEPGALAVDRAVPLFKRSSGFLRRACDLEATSLSSGPAAGGAITT
jgi:hypothetical protein